MKNTIKWHCFKHSLQNSAMLRLKIRKFFYVVHSHILQENGGFRCASGDFKWRLARTSRSAAVSTGALSRLSAARIPLRTRVRPCRSRRAQPPARCVRATRQQQTLGARVEQQCRPPIRKRCHIHRRNHSGNTQTQAIRSN